LEYIQQDLDYEADELKAEYEHASYADLRERGKAVYPLQIDKVKTGLFGRTVVTFVFSTKFGGGTAAQAKGGTERARADAEIPSTFKVGTIVEVLRKSKTVTNKHGRADRPHKKNSTSDTGDEPCGGMVSRVSRRSITVVMHLPEGSREFDIAPPVVIQLVSDVVTFERMARALRRLNAKSRPPSVICDAPLRVLFHNGPGRQGIAPASFEVSRKFLGTDFKSLQGQASSAMPPRRDQFMCWRNEWFTSVLNQEQREAVAMYVLDVASCSTAAL